MISSNTSSLSDAFVPRLVIAGDDLAEELDDVADDVADRQSQLATLIRLQLKALGEDPTRPGMLRTPERAASALQYLTRGYEQTVEDLIGEGVFDESHDGMVMVRDIEFYSLCEHHMLPFYGKAHVAYIPDGRIIGLSKMARVVDMFARRYQVQERLTDQVADAIQKALSPRGVAVLIEAEHMCMMMRGVEKQNSSTVTSAVRGCFLHDARTRDEFLRMAHG